MDTVRIVLKEPFMKYPAGTVFELDEAPGDSGWDPDERVRDRQPFSDKRTYHLPDMGRGRAAALPAYLTAPCPPEIFEDLDLRTGPCRVTAVKSGKGEELLEMPQSEGVLQENNVSLLEKNGLNAQALQVDLPETEAFPVKLLLVDHLRSAVVRETPVKPTTINNSCLAFDFSDLYPGFYQFLICYPGDIRHSIQFVKSFPILVTLQPNGRYSLQKTLY